jgi:hypothetical protein
MNAVIPGRTRPCAGEPGIQSRNQASGFRVHAKSVSRNDGFTDPLAFIKG